jgi:hypothetical protein
MEDTQKVSEGRDISILAYGKTADELELDALDKAREFFGPHVRLEVRRNYAVVSSGKMPALMMASVIVREIIAADQHRP